MEKIQENGYVIVSKEEILTWQKCPHCYRITYGTFSFKALNADPICMHCGHFIMGAPLPSVEDRIKLLGYSPWEHSRGCVPLVNLAVEMGIIRSKHYE